MSEASPERRERYRPTDEDLQRRDRLGLPDYWDAAELLCNDVDLRIFHRFRELRVFVILRLQHRLQAMAVSLNELRERRTNGQEIEAIQADSSLDDLTKNIEATLKDYGMKISSTFGTPQLMFCRCCTTSKRKAG